MASAHHKAKRLKLTNRNSVGLALATKLPDKSSQASSKHSTLFYISAAGLFNNRRLKQKRCKWAAALKNGALQRKTKTDSRRRQLCALQPDVTIDLLSDDEEEVGREERDPVEAVMQPQHIPVTQDLNVMQNNFPTIVIYPDQIDLTRATALRLVPMIRPQKEVVRKRKVRSARRRAAAQPILLNNESIVLTDDSDTEVSSPKELPTIAQRPICIQQHSAQVDEEVTVSLVPRSSTASTCANHSSISNTNNNKTSELFPMLPDETTVHTVIANRIYELSLTKLREGLASCGIPEFADNQNKISPTRRKCMANPPVVTPPQAPISLKLSSDLSISLISDDEDNEDEVANEQHQQQKHQPQSENLPNPALLQQLPDHVTVAPIRGLATAETPHTTTRRRKLG